MAEDGAYLDFGGERGGPSHFPVLQPQFKQAARPTHAPTRDRFRVPQYGDNRYDDVEDDASGGLRLDSLDDRLLQQPYPSRQQPYPSRQQQAKQGRARLSLAPGPSTFFGGASNGGSQVSYQPRAMLSQTQASHQSQKPCYQAQVTGRAYEDDAHLSCHTDGPMLGQLSRYAYNATSRGESSSDVQLGPSSSPALRASQRKAECAPFPDVEHARAGPAEYQTQRAARSYQQDTCQPSRLVEEPQGRTYQYERIAFPPVQTIPRGPQPRAIHLPHAPPTCQGIRLVPVSTLPDRLRTVFPYPAFNAVQSKCFDMVFGCDDNFVLASPTGSGKTVILELAICRAVATNATGQYKVVYQAPTKALCSERQRDWAAKFTPLGLKCAELTGDSDASDVRNVQSANIIITTPEKWDSITRKWKDHEKLMRLVKVFLIDEVHILKGDRGAVLEAVVSRMKSIGTDVRFVALSATVPNLQDVAAWLGKNLSQPHIPAPNEKFGEEFRPVKLRKHVCGYVTSTNNDFGFEKTLDGRLPEVIAKYSEGKPIMVFCATRASCANTAKLLANWWSSRPGIDRKWQPPTKRIPVRNKELSETVSSGVAFHHAGLDQEDRTQVEKGFLGLDINVICCTSTLAVGVNLPCHLVILKNTVTYTDEGLQEYSDLEMMQMLGRAGRPQFDDTAVAVIMTRQNKARRYEMMVTGQDLLESKLHTNLVDHMNAEIGLGTIRDLMSARKWLKGTFLYVRLKQNPNHYKLEGARSGQNIEEQVDDICSRDIALLVEHNLVSGEDYFQCTEFGHAMARYYVHFDTMRVFMGIQLKATPSEILSAIAQASEFSRLRFRSGEKLFYKLLNRSPSIRFSIPVNLDLPAHKVSLIVQSVLGSADLAWDGEMAKHRNQYATEMTIIFKNINSLIRCIIDCQIYLGDAVSIHSALMLERSLGSRIWDDSPLQMKQVESIGVVGVRKLVNAGIRTMEDLEACEPSRIETLIGRNPPYGMNILETVKAFPKLRVSLHAQPSSVVKCTGGVKIQIKADIGFINETPPQRFAGKLVYVCLLAEVSDGRKIHFARTSGQKLGHGQSVVFPAILTSPDQSINFYVMCDSIAGSLRGATVKPKIAPSMFPAPKSAELDNTPQRSNTSKRRIEPTKPLRNRSNTSDDFGDDGIDDEELVKATCGDSESEHIDNFPNPIDSIITPKNTAKNKAATNAKVKPKMANVSAEDEGLEPVQLSNGKWACRHSCKDKNACKHLCCKEGMDRPPKKPTVSKHSTLDEAVPVAAQGPKSTQSKLQLTVSKRKISSAVEEIDLTREEKRKKANCAKNEPREFHGLHQLHKTVQKREPPSTLHSLMHTKPAYCYSQGGEHNLSFLQPPLVNVEDASDYGDALLEDLSPSIDEPRAMDGRSYFDEQHSHLKPVGQAGHSQALRIESRGSDTFGDDDSLLGDAMVGLADSQTLQGLGKHFDNVVTQFGDVYNEELAPSFQNDDVRMHIGCAGTYRRMSDEAAAKDAVPVRDDPTHKSRAPSYSSSSSPQPRVTDFEPATSLLQVPELDDLEHTRARAYSPHELANGNTVRDDVELLDLLDTFDDDQMKEEKPVPEAFKDLEPWLYKEFGDIVELVDDVLPA